MVNARAYNSELLIDDRIGDELRQQMLDLGAPASVPLTTLSSHWLNEGDCRFDASYYGNEAFSAQRTIDDCGYTAKPLEQVSEEPFYPGRFKRIYAKTEVEGVPFLTASRMLHFRPTSNAYLAKHSDALNSCRVSPGSILVTRSGSVGRCVLVTRRLSRFAVSDDAIRVLSRDVPSGYLYAFLTSKIGQALITKDQYGSSIKHLEPYHIASIPVPLLPEAQQQVIHREIVRAYELRDEANELLDEADKLLHSELAIKPFDESEVPYLPLPEIERVNHPDIPHPRAFAIKMTELDERFDVSYHVPIVRTAIAQMSRGKYAPIQLSAMAERIFMPPTYKRIYVSKEFGEPILSGSQLFQMSPQNLQFISPQAFKSKPLETYRVHKGWILVTGRGTIGKMLAKPILVSNAWDGWLASHNILRVVPKSSVDGGYITAFLLSQYGSVQIDAKGLGAAISVIAPEDLSNIWIPDAPPEIQEVIGQRVAAAFKKKDDAAEIEETAIRQLEDTLEHSA